MSSRSNGSVESYRTIGICLAIATTVVVAGPWCEQVQGADWPGWRGPQRTGISAEAGWDAAAPQPLWRRPVGPGCASVAVGQGRLYTMGYDDAKGQDVVYCLNAETGAEIWTFPYACSKFDSNHEGGPAVTPTLDGNRLYTLSVEGHLHCIDALSGDVIWKDDLRQSLGAKPPKWGFAGSPVVLDGMVVIDVGVAAAFNKADGELIWKSSDYGAGYSTPMPFDSAGTPSLAVFNKLGLLVLNRTNGQESARFGWETKYGVNAATPIIAEDLAFISSGYNRGCAVVRLGEGNPTKVWESREMRNQMASSVLWQGHLYGFDESTLKCLDLKTGERRWAQRGLGKGSLMSADGKLIVQSEDGNLVIAEASPQGFAPLSTTEQAVSGRSWVVPVLANGRIFCRSNKGELACFDVR